MDPASGNCYYFHAESGVSQWSKPAMPLAAGAPNRRASPKRRRGGDESAGRCVLGAHLEALWERCPKRIIFLRHGEDDSPKPAHTPMRHTWRGG